MSLLGDAVLGGVAGGAVANLDKLRKEAEDMRKRSFATLLNEYEQSNIELRNELSTTFADRNRVEDRENALTDAETSQGYSKELIAEQGKVADRNRVEDRENKLTDTVTDQTNELERIGKRTDGLLGAAMIRSADKVKAEYKPGQALEKLGSISKAMGLLKAGKTLDDDAIKSLLEKNPEFAPFLDFDKEMSPEDLKETLNYMETFRAYLRLFVPDQEEEEVTQPPPLTPEDVDETVLKQPPGMKQQPLMPRQPFEYKKDRQPLSSFRK